MNFPPKKPSTSTHVNFVRPLKSERNASLPSFYHRQERSRSTRTNSAFHSFPSFSYLTMPYINRNRPRSLKSNIQITLYNFLERPAGLKCFFYHCSVFMLVIVCLVLSVLITIERFTGTLSVYVYWIEIFLVVFFGFEYILRLWSAGCRSKYMGLSGRFRFARKPIAIVGEFSFDQNEHVFLSLI